MDTKNLETSFIHKKKYGRSPDALQNFRNITKKESYMAIESLNIDVTKFVKANNEGNEGYSLRCFSKLTDDFYSMESINFANNGRIDSFTKCIGYGEGGNVSPVIRFDIGGRVHDSNRITNK